MELAEHCHDWAQPHPEHEAQAVKPEPQTLLQTLKPCARCRRMNLACEVFRAPNITNIKLHLVQDLGLGSRVSRAQDRYALVAGCDPLRST